MRKLLVGFLMTLRWLLVPLLPVLGHVTGLLLMPEVNPAWTSTFDHRFECLGYYADEGHTSFLISQKNGTDIDGKRTSQVIGFQIETGQRLFATEVSSGEMIPGTTYQLVQDNQEDYTTMVLFDWKNHQEIGRFELEGFRYFLSNVKVMGDLMACLTDRVVEHSFVCWNFKSAKLLCQYRMPSSDSGSSPLIDYQLSPDGKTVILLCHTRPGFGPTKTEDRYARIIDLESGKEIQTVATLEYVFWNPDSQSFAALIRDQQGGTVTFKAQTFSRLGGTFVESGNIRQLLFGRINYHPSDDISVVATSNILDPKRKYFGSLLGEWAQPVMKRFWPEASIINIYRSSTSELLKSWTLPGIDIVTLLSPAYLRPDGQGIILLDDRKHTLTCWDFYPSSRWYPRLGLALGLTLAILLAWFNLRRTREVKPAHA